LVVAGRGAARVLDVNVDVAVDVEVSKERSTWLELEPSKRGQDRSAVQVERGSACPSSQGQGSHAVIDGGIARLQVAAAADAYVPAGRRSDEAGAAERPIVNLTEPVPVEEPPVALARSLPPLETKVPPE